jgi:hypothetical protein
MECANATSLRRNRANGAPKAFVAGDASVQDRLLTEGTAGPSTPLRYGRDDKLGVGASIIIGRGVSSLR